MVAFLRSEPAAPRVRAAIEAGALASWINLGEAIYVLARAVGLDQAEDAVRGLAAALRAESPDESLIRGAARIKATRSLSYADAFAVATAIRHRAPLLTADPEILALGDEIQVVDLRKP